MIGRTNASKSTAGSSRRLWMIVAALAALALCFPIDATTAYLTSMKDAPTTTGGTGRWCAVPDPATHPNVYRLKSFKPYSSTGSSIIIVPVVNNGEFGTKGTSQRLGVRAWACKSDSLVSNSQVKVTAWRTSASPTLNWLPRVNGNGFASHRLDPLSGFGAEIVYLHRNGSTGLGGASLTLNDRQKYSWLMSSDRTKTAREAKPSCVTTGCVLSIGTIPTFASAFKPDSSGSRPAVNSVEYLASSYWTGSGQWDGGLVTGPSEQQVKLNGYTGPQPPFSNGSGPTSTDGRQIEWVVMEWWGSTAPTEDMVLEVFVQ